MFSIRNLKHAALSVGLVAGLCGCARTHVAMPVIIEKAPLGVDPALNLRDWAVTPALYPDGAVDAGPTLFAYEPKRDMAPYHYYYADSGIYLLNLVLMPYRAYQTPPWTTVTYPGELIEPTYHAMPALPPEAMDVVPHVIEQPPVPPEVTEPIAPPPPPAPPEAPPADAPPATQPGN